MADEVREHFPELVLRSTIPRSVRVSEAPSYGQTVMTYDPGSSGALSYLEAARELACRAEATWEDLVAAPGDVELVVIATASNTVVATLPVGLGPYGAAVTPDGADWARRPRVDNAMVKALARAFRWRKMLDDGVHATLEDLARARAMGFRWSGPLKREDAAARNLTSLTVHR